MCGAGRRTLIFPITFRRTIAGQCRIREQNRDFGIIPEREFILPQGIYYQNFRELSGKRICSDTERRARNPVVGSERAQSHHDTEWDEARGKSKSRSCAVIERDDGRINHNSYSTGLELSGRAGYPRINCVCNHDLQRIKAHTIHADWKRLLVIRARFISSEINKLLAEA